MKQTQYVSNRDRAAADVNKLQNATHRNEELLKAGAISTGTREDTEDALAAARATLNAAKYDEDSATIKAPFTGIMRRVQGCFHVSSLLSNLDTQVSQ